MAYILHSGKPYSVCLRAGETENLETQSVHSSSSVDGLERQLSNCGLQPLWRFNNPFTGVIYQIFCISYIHIMIRNSSKIIVMNYQQK